MSRESDVRSDPWTLPSLLRLAAFALVVVGFVGAVSSESSPVSGDSVYSLLFFAGVACAAASIYLGIFLQDDE